jgi:hypothetical protein
MTSRTRFAIDGNFLVPEQQDEPFWNEDVIQEPSSAIGRASAGIDFAASKRSGPARPLTICSSFHGPCRCLRKNNALDRPVIRRMTGERASPTVDHLTVVKVQTKRLANGLPARSVAPVVIVAVNRVPVASEAVGAKAVIVEVQFTVPVIEDPVESTTVKVVAGDIKVVRSITSLNFALTI